MTIFVLKKRTMPIARAIWEQLIRDSIATDFRETKWRQLVLPLTLNRVITISGARRTGKTSLMLHVLRQLRHEMPDTCLLYLNLEDDRLFEASLADLDTLLESYYGLFPANRKKEVYFFLDELQRIPGWESFIRRIHDQNAIRIFISGSSAALLSREIATSLRGRTLTFEVFPLSFREWLHWQQLPVQVGSSAENAFIQQGFVRYAASTAFPELLDWPERERQMALQEYVDLIIYRDVAERLQEGSVTSLKYLTHFLFSNAGRLISVRNVYNDLRGQGLSISKDKLYAYIEALEDAYLIYWVPLYSRNLKVRQRNPRKMYLLDHGLKRTVSISADEGAVLENIVFLALRRRFADIYYWQNQQEVDFIVPTNSPDGLLALNVCKDITQATTREREINGLLACMEDLYLNSAWLLTEFQEEELIIGDKRIHIYPIWKWLLLE